MKRASTILTLLSSLVILASPLSAIAADFDGQQMVYSSPILITEVQTGANSASDEFVELYNVSDQGVDMTGWQVRYINAQSSTAGTTLLATIGTDSSPVTLAAHSYFVLRTGNVPVAETAGSQVYSAKLSSADKAVALFVPNLQTCALEVMDAIGWGSSLDGEGAAASSNGLTNGDRLLTRYRTAAGDYVDSNTNSFDFKLAKFTKNTANPTISVGATPGTDNQSLLAADSVLPPAGNGSSLNSIDISGCEIPEETTDPQDNGLEAPIESPPATVEPTTNDSDSTTTASSSKKAQPVMPARDIGLTSPQLTELLPNPGKPQTDALDEFVELYNSNSVAFDLSGFILTTGKRQYVFPQGTMLEPKAFKAFYSANTKLNLSNSQGQVQLLDPFGKAISSTEAYGTAKDNQAWVLAGGAWSWTTTPTPNSANVIKAPAATKKKATTTSAKNKASAKSATAANYSPKGVSYVAGEHPTAESFNPLHPGVLALVAIFAILYGAYEYRTDVANRIHQFRIYRAARRENRRKS
jgi:hypothetical protein